MILWLILEIVIWIVFGGLIGYVASKFVTPGQHPNFLIDVGIGILGAFLGGLAVKLSTGTWFYYGLNLTSFFLALAGAIGLLVVFRLIRFWLV